MNNILVKIILKEANVLPIIYGMLFIPLLNTVAFTTGLVYGIASYFIKKGGE